MRQRLIRLMLLGVFLDVGCTVSQFAAVQRATQPYSISGSFDLTKVWRIAVLPPTADVAGADDVVEHAALQLMKVPKFVVVDRSEVSRILQEQQLSYSGVVDPATAARLGKLLGASAVMTIRIGNVRHDDFFSDSPDQRDAEVFVKIIAVETAEVLYSAQGQASSFEGAADALRGAVTMALLPLMERGSGR
ncbi:MAG: CsgG/HfaB family protein [candidate division WOR-3 bacterium]